MPHSEHGDPKHFAAGAVLSSRSILECIEDGILGIVPFTRQHLQPASYDVMLAQDVTLQPGEFRLASSIERFIIYPVMRGELSTRSSVARLGVTVHLGAGYFDPGFDGDVTFEMFNYSLEVRTLKRGDRIGQMAFTWLDSTPLAPYDGRYQGQEGPTESRFEHGDR